MFIISCWITNYPQNSNLKQRTFIISLSVGQGSGSSLAGCSGSAFHEVTVKLNIFINIHICPEARNYPTHITDEETEIQR